jgi:hypothetical protein
MPSMKTASGPLHLATLVAVLGWASLPGCDSGPLKADGGSGSGGHQTGAGGDVTGVAGSPTGGAAGSSTGGAAGSSTGGAAGSSTGHAGASGNAGTSGSGAAGATDGGAAGKGGGMCICTDIYQPVCGSDGETYPNRCSADCARVTVAHEGACTAPVKDAGVDGPLGRCDQNSDCETRPPATGCSCIQVCAAKSDPQPPPPKFRCGIVCPAIATTCTCYRHVCTSGAPI